MMNIAITILRNAYIMLLVMVAVFAVYHLIEAHFVPVYLLRKLIGKA